jgi:hypothetical protein
MAITDNLISCWNTRNNLWDAVSHYNAYGNNPDYQKVGDKYLFRRDTSFAGNNLEFQPAYYVHSVFTMSFDCITTVTNPNYIMLEHGAAMTNGHCFHVYATGYRFVAHTPGTDYNYDLADTIDGSLHRIMYVANLTPGSGGTVTIYRDGALIGTVSPSYWVLPAVDSHFGWFRGEDPWAWNGSIGRIRYWDRALNASEALQDVTYEYPWVKPAITVALKTPISVWKCSEGTGQILYDTKGSNNLNAGASVDWVTGRGNGRTYAYDPYAHHCAFQNVSLSLTNKISVCFWAKIPWNTGRNAIGALFRFNGTGDEHLAAAYTDGAQQYKDFVSWRWVGGYNSGAISHDEWNHFAVVIGDGSYQWYINGYTSTSGSGTASMADVTQMTLGYYIEGFLYPGYVNDLVIYNDTISQSDVSSAMGLFNPVSLRHKDTVYN